MKTLSDIERQILQLPLGEQLGLIERLASSIRKRACSATPDREVALTAMASDPQIQLELAQIEREFALAEADGLDEGSP